TFRFVGLPGRGAVSAQGWGRGYLSGVGADKIKDLKDVLPLTAFHTVAEVNPEKGADSVTCDLVLIPGRTLGITILDVDDKPLADLELSTITREPVADPRETPKLDVTAGTFPRDVRTDKDGKFCIDGLAPGLKYRLALHKGTYLLQPDGTVEKGVTVKAGET